MTIDPQGVLAFWFGDIAEDGTVADDRMTLWWKKAPKTDDAIRGRFASVVEKAAGGELDAWRETAEGRLALIVSLDQFPRNIYRDDPRAFAFDATAQKLCLEGLRRRHDQQLAPIQRVFHYMPLEHAEDRDLQQQCVALFMTLHREATPALQKTSASYVEYAERHKAIIDRFGRFPHRNAVLGRESTEEELAFLKQPGSSF